MPSARPPWLLALAAFLLPLGFAAFTGHMWEDYLITLRASRNLVEGHGLVFTVGERLHTYTSPLGVLLPALCTWIAGVGREAAALWLFRLVSAAALAGAAVLAWRRASSLGLGPLGRVAALGLILADAKLTDFSVNGMETALLVYFLLLLWSELESPQPPRASRLGLALAGLMWTRPDAFILAGALLVAHLCFRSRPTAEIPVRPAWGNLGRGAVLGVLLYVPWLLWAWWYYGSPIPHTIVAKSAYLPPLQLASLWRVPWGVLTGEALLVDLYLPSYWIYGGWPAGLVKLAHGLTVIAAFGWLIPQWPAAGRRLSLALFLGMFYLCSIILFPWYVPPWSVLASLALAFALDAFYTSRWVSARASLKTACRLAVALLLCAQAAMWIGTAWQMRIQQNIVETGVRRRVGEWLKEHAQPGDTVFLEPLGYIGYYSNLKTYDIPGLSSREVVEAVKGGAHSYAALIGHFHPTWVVLRPPEAARAEFVQRPVLDDYEIVKRWDAVPALDQITLLPGRPWNEVEAQYLVYHRKAAGR